ncbi:MAG: family 43 glycosylhydrolase [Planctomycetota bacterium]
MTPTLQNLKPRTDKNGNVIDCHDGCLRYFEGRYYWYGTAYGDTDGFVKTNYYVVYSSPDLETWTAHGDLLDKRLDGVCYRPYVVFNPNTKKYVLWFNWYPVLWEGQFGVATSDTPTGPFTMVNPDAKVAQPEPGDHNLFVDDDGAGYLIYTSIPDQGNGDHGMSVERLDDTFTKSVGENSGIFDVKVEAPALIKHGVAYYCIFGNTCCFCPEGAGARVYRAESPMGPWTFVQDINRDEDGRIIVSGQQTDIAELPTPEGPVFLWMADLWESRPDGIKGHDIQHWEPMTFADDGTPQRLRGLDEFELAVPE